MLKGIFFFVFTATCLLAKAQMKQKQYRLPPALNEISGLERFNDTLLIAHNDGGNAPIIYFLSLTGKVVHSCFIGNAANVDWEDLTKDAAGFLYIADVGNNNNNRTDLCIYKINLANAWTNDTVFAVKLPFYYPWQAAFPPEEAALDFDCEVVFCKNDSLFLLSKSRAIPWHGIAYISAISATDTVLQPAKKQHEFYISGRSWRTSAVTAASYYSNLLYVLTYNRLLVYSAGKANPSFSRLRTYRFNRYTQKEALVVLDSNTIVVAAERNRLLGGPFLSLISIK